METFPLAPTLAMTRFGTVWPGPMLRLEAVGRPSPVGHTVRYVASVGSVPVTLRTTPETPLAGTPAAPATCRLMLALGPTALDRRVSRMRAGVRAVKVPGLLGGGDGGGAVVQV